MVGVRVGVQNRVQPANVLSDGLLAKVRSRIDENDPPVVLHENGRTRAPIMRVTGPAYSAIAADCGYTHRGPTAQDRERCFHLQWVLILGSPGCGGRLSALVTST